MKAPGTKDLPRAVFCAYFVGLNVWFVLAFVPWREPVNWLMKVEGTTWASWTQAFGAIAALAFAYWYPERRLRQEAAAKELAAYRATHTLAVDIHAQIVHSMADEQPRFDDLTLDHLFAAYRQIDAAALQPSDRQHLTMLQSTLRRISRRLRTDSPNPLPRSEVGQLAAGIANKVLIPMGKTGRIH